MTINQELKEQIKKAIDFLSSKYKYRPIPKIIKEETYALYRSELNGFDNMEVKKYASISGTPICPNWDRVVIGDYGAYLEFTPYPEIEFDIPKAQQWRYNKEYILQRGLSIKYYWLEFKGVKVYLQIGPVKYADYIPGKYYISVLDLD